MIQSILHTSLNVSIANLILRISLFLKQWYCLDAHTSSHNIIIMQIA